MISVSVLPVTLLLPNSPRLDVAKYVKLVPSDISKVELAPALESPVPPLVIARVPVVLTNAIPRVEVALFTHADPLYSSWSPNVAVVMVTSERSLIPEAPDSTHVPLIATQPEDTSMPWANVEVAPASVTSMAPAKVEVAVEVAMKLAP